MLIDGKEWKMVPVEPDSAMVCAGEATTGPRPCWLAMLAAAPTPPAVQGDNFSGCKPPMTRIAGVSADVMKRAAEANRSFGEPLPACRPSRWRDGDACEPSASAQDAAELLESKANKLESGKRVPQVDRHMADVLRRAAEEIRALPCASAQQAEQLPVELRAVAETVADGGGFWTPCTGCYDTEDGCPTQKYAHSDVFGCEMGNGCRECGGLGVVWDDTDYAAMAEFMEQPDAAPAPSASRATHEEGPRDGADDESGTLSIESIERTAAVCSMFFASRLRFLISKVRALESAAPAALTDEQIVILRRETDKGPHAPRASDLAFARALLAAPPAAPQPSAKTPTGGRPEPTDEAIEDFLSPRTTNEGRVPMTRTIREALVHFASPQLGAKATLVDEMAEFRRTFPHYRNTGTRPDALDGWKARALRVAEQPSAKALTLIREKLERFEACAADDEGCDIGRHWLDALTTVGFLSRIQRAPAMWSLTPAGEAVLAAEQPSELPRHALEAWRAVVRERRRQIAEEGWTPEHDDEHAEGQLAQAAATYAAAAALDGPDASVMQDLGARGTPHHILAMWPWDMEWWKPKDRRRNLERAGALILAELERDIRAKQKDAAIAKGDSHA